MDRLLGQAEYNFEKKLKGVDYQSIQNTDKTHMMKIITVKSKIKVTGLREA